MAARRLIIIMVVLLTISTLAAALVPQPEERSDSASRSSTSSTETTRAERKSAGGELVEAEVDTEARKGRPSAVELAPGDQLALTVTSPDPGEVSVPAFGLLEFTGPGDPARFDILVEKSGRYPVRFAGGGTIAVISARDRDAQSS